MRGVLWVVAGSVVALAGCGEGGVSEGGPRAGTGSNAVAAEGPSGVVVADGSSTVYPITHAAKGSYERANPNAQVIVGVHGTTGGFTRYLSGDVDVVNASRAATPDEQARAREKGLDWTPFLVGHDGVTVVVNPTNRFVKDLSVEQLKRLFEPGSSIRSWKDLDPSWPDRKINLYVPDEDSGTFDFFTEAIVGKVDAQRTDVKTSADDGTLVKDVGGDPDGLGYFGFSYYGANKGDVRAVPIRRTAESPPVPPELETLLRREYVPLGRPLYIYVKNDAMRRPEVAEFVRHYLENVEELATMAGYVPPSDEDVAANARALAALTSARGG
jgi:phosphate transport system substrate-binding protein